MPADIEKAQEVEHLGSWIYHPTDPRLLTCSRELCRIFGLRENEFDGHMESFFTLVHPEDREAVERAYMAAIVDNIPYSLEHRIVRPDGSVRWVHAQASSNKAAPRPMPDKLASHNNSSPCNKVLNAFTLARWVAKRQFDNTLEISFARLS